MGHSMGVLELGRGRDPTSSIVSSSFNGPGLRVGGEPRKDLRRQNLLTWLSTRSEVAAGLVCEPTIHLPPTQHRHTLMIGDALQPQSRRLTKHK